MKLSTKGRYGLRAFVDLAVNEKGGPVSLTNIAGRQGISVSYLEQLMAKLRRARLVESIRGVKGGYRLARSASEISVGEVLRALEGDLTPADCVIFDPKSGSCECGISAECVGRIVWKKIHDSINETVDGILIGELVEQSIKFKETA
jgi:Rrf2 family protein